MSQIGNLTVRIGADVSDLQRGIGDATGKVRKFSGTITPVIKTIAAVGAAASAAAVGLAAFTRSGMNAIDEQAKLARQLDSTIGGLRALQLAGEDAGVSTGTLNSAMERLSSRLGEAQTGTGQAAEALKALGMQASALAGMDVDQRMSAIADRVNELGLSGAQTANLLRDLGIRNTEMVNLLRQGGDAIRAARGEIEDYGLAISEVDAAAIEAANDALSRVGLVVESLRSSLAVELAPIVLVIADRFNEAAREAGGFGSIIDATMDSAVTKIGAVLDALQNMRVGLKRGSLFVAEMDLAFANFAQSAWDSIGGFIDAWIEGLNNIITIMNKIPGMGGIEQVGSFGDSEFMGRIAEQADVARGRVNLLQLDMNELENQQMPSEWIHQFMDDVEARRNALKAQIKEDGGFIPGLGIGDPSGSGGSGGEGGGELDKAQAEELERRREFLAQRVEMLRESLMTEAELEMVRFQERMAQLEEARALDVEGIEDFDQLKENLAQQHEDRLDEIAQKGANERTRIQEQEARARQQDMSQMWTNLISLTSANSKRMFQIGKAAAIANAVINTYQGVSKTLATYPWPIAGVMAGAHLAAGLAQVSSIRSQSFGGGGGSSGGIGGGRGAPTQQPTGSPEQQSPAGGTLTVEGISSSALFTGDAVRELAEELINYQKRGGTITIA